MSKTTNNIIFPCQYDKLKGQGNTAILVAAFPYEISLDTPIKLIEYDTLYNGNYYQLKRGKYILLLFIGAKGIFSVMHPLTNRSSDNLEFYNKKVGEKFKIIIKENDS